VAIRKISENLWVRGSIAGRDYIDVYSGCVIVWQVSGKWLISLIHTNTFQTGGLINVIVNSIYLLIFF
jgi:hypothetical protein